MFCLYIESTPHIILPMFSAIMYHEGRDVSRFYGYARKGSYLGSEVTYILLWIWEPMLNTEVQSLKWMCISMLAGCETHMVQSGQLTVFESFFKMRYHLTPSAEMSCYRFAHGALVHRLACRRMCFCSCEVKFKLILIHGSWITL